MKDVADFPSLLETFFTRRLIAQRKASPHSVAAYQRYVSFAFAVRREAGWPKRHPS